MANDTILLSQLRIPGSIISEELEGLYGSEVLSELQSILKLYKIYDKGAEFQPEGSNGDYTPSDLRYKEARKLINREARFLFSKHPDIRVMVPYSNSREKKQADAVMTAYQSYIDNVIDSTQFYSKLVKAARDCFIGKRVAYFINCDEEKERITIDFVPSLEFVYDVDPEDTNKLTKLVTFYMVNDSANKTAQRIYKKRYRLENGICYLYEAVFDGTGQEIEVLTEERPTKFSYIPGGVILNDGLTGDTDGESEIRLLEEYESTYSRIANADIDAERKGMNPIRWARDMSPESTKGLSIAAGAFWDLSTDQNAAEGATGEVGVLETTMGYTAAVNTTLGRLRSTMFEELDIPDTSAEALKGVVSSGKTLKAIYWPLIVRCDEKMLVWRPAIRNIFQTVIDCAKLYPRSASNYLTDPLPDAEYTLEVDNQYPLPEDEQEEKALDLTEVSSQTMSKKSYIKKWRGLTDGEADQELEQIAKERELLEDSFSMPGFGEEETNPKEQPETNPEGEEPPPEENPPEEEE